MIRRLAIYVHSVTVNKQSRQQVVQIIKLPTNTLINIQEVPRLTNEVGGEMSMHTKTVHHDACCESDCQ
jgi:hypothetical protein